ncbi:MAG: MFS transporter [Candidatus Micrarchaeota archaeon]|nr:MFS transporter [Candidatus Micrarchaeota archaeon]
MPNYIKQRRTTMNLSIIEGGLYSGMVGFCQYFITPYAIFLGMPNFMIGLLRSISSFISALGFYFSVWLMQFERSRKEMISKYISYQAYTILLFLLIPLLPLDRSLFFILLYSLFLFFGSVVSPVWTSLMKDVVIKKERGIYFGNRNKLSGLFEVVSSLAAGAILNYFTGNVYIGFLTIFIVAFLFRVASSRLIMKHWDPNGKIFHDKRKKGFSFQFSLVNDKYLNNLILLGGGMLFATNIAGPFFAVFMLKNLNFSYFDFTVATIASTIATLISQPYWGKLIDRYGTRPILFSTSLLIPIVPLLWIPADSLLYVIIIQLYAGVVWAGFDLAVFNMLLKIAPKNSTSLYSASYNGAVSILTFSGMLVGSILILFLDNIVIEGWHSIQILFLISSALRFVVFGIAIPRITENMQVDSLKFFLKTITVYPIKGVLSEVEQGTVFAEQVVLSTSRFILDPIGSFRKISRGFQASIKLISKED